MFKRRFLLLLLLLAQSVHSSIDMTDFPFEVPHRSILFKLDPPPGFEALSVKIILLEDDSWNVDSIVVDTGSSIYEIDAANFNISRPLNLNELRPVVVGVKEVYDSASFHLFYGPRTRVECGKDKFEWAQQAIKVTVYPDTTPNIEPSNIYFELCEKQTDMERNYRN